MPASVVKAQNPAEFDIVLANGRVIDPESNTDAVRHVGIRGNKIAALSASPLRGSYGDRRKRSGHRARLYRSAFAWAGRRKLSLQSSGRGNGTFLPRDNAIHRVATPEEVRQITDVIRQGLDEGGLGIGFGINYVPTTTRAEVFDLFALAAERGVANYVHTRHPGAVEPGSGVGGLQEVLADVAGTGASLHVVHITSMCLRQTDTCLKMIEGASGEAWT